MPYSGGYPEGQGLKWVRGRYDFAVDGGATGTIAITSEKIPSGAIILGGVLEVDTALASGGSATVAVKVEGAADTIAVTAFDASPWSSTGRKSVIPAFTGAASLKTTAARDISVVIAAAALTGGVFDVMLAYIAMGD